VNDRTTSFPQLQPADERTGLEERLDHCRDVVLSKVVDLDDPQASAQPLAATNLTVGGIVKHLAFAEDRWFVGKVMGQPLPEPWESAPLTEDPDWPFHSSREHSVDDLVALYSAACARSREVAGRFNSLDEVAAVVSFGRSPVNLRWLLIHMIDETSRHLGHLDLLRDAIDASTASPTSESGAQ
jgi:uncharacterized damage-inducible protein DinB